MISLPKVEVTQFGGFFPYSPVYINATFSLKSVYCRLITFEAPVHAPKSYGRVL